MQVILLEDVKSLGKKGDLVEVSDGYARNFLLPRKKGVEANAKNKNDLKLKKAQDEKNAAAKLAEAQATAEALKGKKVTIPVRTGEKGKMFGSVSTKDVSDACKEQLSLDVDKKKVTLADNMKELGEYTVTVKLHPAVSAELTVELIEQ